MLPENLVWLIPASYGLFAIIVIVIAYNRTRPAPIIEHVVMRAFPVLPMNRHYFMEFFRNDDDDHMGSLSVEDRIEIFRTVMLGSSDFTERLLNDVLHDYCANHVVAMTKQRVSKELLTEMFEAYLIDNAPDAETLAIAVRKHLWEIL